MPFSGDDYGKLHPDPGRKSDAGAARGRYRLCLCSHELFWDSNGQHGHDRHLSGVEQYHSDLGIDEYPGGGIVSLPLASPVK